MQNSQKEIAHGYIKLRPPRLIWCERHFNH